MAYVYKHTRIDNNEIFYIGIGSDENEGYKRANTTQGRNSWWYKITNKTSYRIEILYDNLDPETACEKEIELIKVIGRKCINEGTLVNLTEGGEGFRGQHTEESKKKISENLTGKTYEEIHGINADKERLKRHVAAKNQWANVDEKVKKEMYDAISAKQRGIPKVFKSVICPHCLKEGKENNMYRWHFDNCKNK